MVGAFIGLTFFFIIPITFVQILANIESIEKVVPFFKPIINTWVDLNQNWYFFLWNLNYWLTLFVFVSLQWIFDGDYSRVSSCNCVEDLPHSHSNDFNGNMKNRGLLYDLNFGINSSWETSSVFLVNVILGMKYYNGPVANEWCMSLFIIVWSFFFYSWEISYSFVPI